MTDLPIELSTPASISSRESEKEVALAASPFVAAYTCCDPDPDPDTDPFLS